MTDGDKNGAAGRVAVITGGASGIGLASAEHLAQAGHRVALLDQQGDLAEKSAKELRNNGYSVIGGQVDVTDRGAVDAALANVRSEFGSIDVIVTSAGIDGDVPFVDITLEAWNRLIEVNLTGTFNAIQAVVPDMIEKGWGRIITISSSSAQSGAPNRAHYVASKGGVIALTKALAFELSPLGITANTIPPSIIDTPMAQNGVKTGVVPDLDALATMTPVRRTGTPDDVAAAAAFLASDHAGFITGQIIGVNGGWYL
jgi:2-hydroxycyclohexanecarboxyl-CoA dehydrogenase